MGTPRPNLSPANRAGLVKAKLVGNSIGALFVVVLLLFNLQEDVNFYAVVLPPLATMFVIWLVLVVLPTQRKVGADVETIVGAPRDDDDPPGREDAFPWLIDNMPSVLAVCVTILLVALSWLVVGTGGLTRSPFAQVGLTMLVLGQVLITTPVTQRTPGQRALVSLVRGSSHPPQINFLVILIGGLVAAAIQAYPSFLPIPQHVSDAKPIEHYLVTALNLLVSTYVNYTVHRARTRAPLGKPPPPELLSG
jgi:hypothetical protein